MKKYLKLIRVKHWLKNALVFLPLFFSNNLLKLDYLITTLIVFFVFSFSSSIVYVINDINDIEKDKKHPIKKKRPLAAGIISIKNAYKTIAILVAVALIMISILYIKTNNLTVVIIPIVYIIMNLLYSKWLKNIPIVDVTILVLGFLLRVIYGGAVILVEVSKWLYLMIIFGSFYLGFGKRRNEIIKNGEKSRKVLELYNKDFLDKNMYVALTLAVVSYTLWCVDPITTARIGHDYMFWTIPILMIILQLYSLNIERDSYGDPIDVILSDKVLVATIIIFIIIMIGLLYII